MLCAYCGRSCGTALEGRAKWVEKFGTVGKVPICERCRKANVARDDKAATRLARAYQFATGGYWCSCPNCGVSSIILSAMTGTCRRCGTKVRGTIKKRNQGQPDAEFTKRRERELAESRLRYEEKMIEKASAVFVGRCGHCNSPNIKRCECRICLGKPTSITGLDVGFWCGDCGKYSDPKGNATPVDPSEQQAFYETWGPAYIPTKDRPATKPPLKLRVGGKYKVKRNQGEYVVITSESGGILIGEIHYSDGSVSGDFKFNQDGAYCCSVPYTCLNIVEEIG